MALAPYYVPELDLSEDKGADVALVRIFAYMLKEIVDRLNQVPEKNFISYLEMLGVKLLPAHAATAPVTFSLRDGTKEPVLIPERTQVAAGEVIYETEKNMLATPAKIVDAYCVDFGKDGIYKSPSNVVSGEFILPIKSKLIYGTDLNNNEIFLSTTDGFNVYDTLITDLGEYSLISKVSGSKIILSHNLFNEYVAGRGIQKKINFELFEGYNLQEHILYLGHDDLFNLKKEANIYLIIPDLSNIDNFIWECSFEQDSDTKEITWNPVKAEYNDTVLLLTIKSPVSKVEINGIKSYWIRCRVSPSRMSGIGDMNIANIKIGLIEAKVQSIVVPEIVFNNDIPQWLTEDPENFKTPIYPFGKMPMLYDTFYIASKDAFSKKNMEIQLNFTLSQPISANIDKIDFSWEYWDGNGWRCIRDLNDMTIGFSRSDNVIFPCPEDIKSLKVNGQENYWIRVRIVSLEHIEKIPEQIPQDIFIYYDEKYPSNWINKGISKKLALEIENVLKNGNFNSVIGGADDLRLFMQSKSHGIVIMTMDIAPDTIFKEHNFSIVKNWLENGGILIWMGDWEFYYSGDNGGNKITTYEEGAKKIFDFSDGINEYLGKEDMDGTTMGKKIISHIKSFKSERPANIAKMENEGLIYESYAKNNNFADPVLFRKPNSKYGSFVKFHMHHILDEDVNSIANELWELVNNRLSYFKDKIEPVILRSITINYDSNEYFKLENTLILNNLELRNPERNDFEPFLTLSDSYPTLYLSFNQKLEKGPTNIFFSIEEIDLPTDKIPIVKWQYYAGEDKWNRLEASDRTFGFSRSGVIEFVFPNDFKKTSKFGKELYWIRAIFEKKDEKVNPVINGIYLNTTWAVQAETIKNELLGSNNGTKSQNFTLRRAPLISEEIWINEVKTISEAERETLLEKGDPETKEIKDKTGTLTEFWVKWEYVEDLLGSSKDDRHYEIDRFSGEVKFGNGIYGKIPPVDTNNIMANYQKGGGTKGNKPVREIKDLKSPILYVDKVFNPLEASGGADIETIENAMERAPHAIKNRNRAITVEDFEQITLQASRGIARAKCLPNFENSTNFKPGWVTLIVIPQSSDDKPKLSLQLKKQVEDYLNMYSANTSILQVIEPIYLEVSVEASIFTISAEVIPDIEKEFFLRIKKFLHPITGSYDGKGWEFGRAPCFSDFYALLEKIDGVDYVENVEINLKIDENDEIISSGTSEDIKIPPYAVIYSGNHQISLNVSKTGGES